MVKKKIIDGATMIVSSPVSGSKYIRIAGVNEDAPTIDINEVKIIGKIQETKEEIELSMDKKVFFEWVDKLRQEGRDMSP